MPGAPIELPWMRSSPGVARRHRPPQTRWLALRRALFCIGVLRINSEACCSILLLFTRRHLRTILINSLTADFRSRGMTRQM